MEEEIIEVTLKDNHDLELRKSWEEKSILSVWNIQKKII